MTSAVSARSVSRAMGVDGTGFVLSNACSTAVLSRIGIAGSTPSMTRSPAATCSGRLGARSVLIAGRPASTVRGWLSRFAAHAEPIRAAFARLERQVNTGGDMDRLAPAGSAVADAVGQVGAAWAAVRRARGPGGCTVSAAEMVAAC